MCGTILHACVLVWGCAGYGRVLAGVPAGAGDMDNYSVSLIGLGGLGVSDSRIP
jgi:hypothetical protein